MRPWGWRLLTTWDMRCRLRSLEYTRGEVLGEGGCRPAGPPLGSRPCSVLLGTQSQGSPVVAFEGVPLNQSEGGLPQGLFTPGEWGLCFEACSDPLGSTGGEPSGLPGGGGI